MCADQDGHYLAALALLYPTRFHNLSVSSVQPVSLTNQTTYVIIIVQFHF